MLPVISPFPPLIRLQYLLSPSLLWANPPPHLLSQSTNKQLYFPLHFLPLFIPFFLLSAPLSSSSIFFCHSFLSPHLPASFQFGFAVLYSVIATFGSSLFPLHLVQSTFLTHIHLHSLHFFTSLCLPFPLLNPAICSFDLCRFAKAYNSTYPPPPQHCYHDTKREI